MRTAWRYIPIAHTTVFILGIVAISINSSGLNKGIFVIIALIFTFQTYISVVYALERHNYEGAGQNAPILVVVSTLWLSVRVIYGVCDAFYRGDWLGVVGSALMVYLMEAVVVSIYLLCGFQD